MALLRFGLGWVFGLWARFGPVRTKSGSNLDRDLAWFGRTFGVLYRNGFETSKYIERPIIRAAIQGVRGAMNVTEEP